MQRALLGFASGSTENKTQNAREGLGRRGAGQPWPRLVGARACPSTFHRRLWQRPPALGGGGRLGGCCGGCRLTKQRRCPCYLLLAGPMDESPYTVSARWVGPMDKDLGRIDKDPPLHGVGSVGGSDRGRHGGQSPQADTQPLGRPAQLGLLRFLDVGQAGGEGRVGMHL